MIALLVPEISPCDGFCDEQQQEQELGFLVVGLKPKQSNFGGEHDTDISALRKPSEINAFIWDFF